MRKVSARWVWRMLIEEQKKVCADVCTDLLSCLQVEPQTVLDRIVTQYDMEACHFSHPISKQGYGDGLLGQSRSYNYKLSVKRFHGHRRILCQ